MVAVALLTVAAGCTAERVSGASTAAPQSTPRAELPPTDMSGRWQLAAGGTACNMNFTGGQSSEGAIRPEGGCPGNFYTSRRWTFEQGSLVIRDHNSEPLGRLGPASPQAFEGQTAAGVPLTLTR